MTEYYLFSSCLRYVHGLYVWPLPRGGKPGPWLEIEGELSRENGLHVMRKEHLRMRPGPLLHEVEIGGESMAFPDCVVVQRARLLRKIETWSQKTLLAWMADCVGHVLTEYNGVYSEDQSRYDIVHDKAMALHKAAQAVLVVETDPDLGCELVCAAVDSAAHASVNPRSEKEWQVERMLAYIHGEVKP